MSEHLADTKHYTLVDDWEQCPDTHAHRETAAVATDSAGRVYGLTRGPAQVLVYENDGSFVRGWGLGQITERAHGITVGPDGSVYVVDDADQTVRKFTPEGELLMTVGTSGAASDTGYDGSDLDTIAYGGPPFNRPTNVAIGSAGELFVSDGYGNCRVHAFTAGGEHLWSVGEPGTGPGQFHLPHGIAVLPTGTLLVADRENDRIQLLDGSGQYLDEWADVQRPTQISIDERRGVVLVSELAWLAGQHSYRHGERDDLPGRVTVLSMDGTVMEQVVIGDDAPSGRFIAPHGIASDSDGNLYVAEVSWSFLTPKGLTVPDHHRSFRQLAYTP